MSISPNYAATGQNLKRSGSASGTDFFQLPTKDSGQMNLRQMAQQHAFGPGFQQGLESLQSLASGDPSAFAQYEAPAYSAYNRFGGQVANQFAGQGMGSSGLQSSGFQNALAQGAGTVSENLASKRLEIQQGSLKELRELLQNLLSDNLFENVGVQKPKSFWNEVGHGLGTGVGMLPGFFI